MNYFSRYYFVSVAVLFASCLFILVSPTTSFAALSCVVTPASVNISDPFTVSVSGGSGGPYSFSLAPCIGSASTYSTSVTGSCDGSFTGTHTFYVHESGTANSANCSVTLTSPGKYYGCIDSGPNCDFIPDGRGQYSDVYSCASGCTTEAYAVKDDPAMTLSAFVLDGSVAPPVLSVPRGTAVILQGIYEFYGRDKIGQCTASNTSGYANWSGPVSKLPSESSTIIGNNKPVIVTQDTTFRLQCFGAQTGLAGRILELNISATDPVPPPPPSPPPAPSCDINRVCADKNEKVRVDVTSVPAGKKAYRYMSVVSSNGSTQPYGTQGLLDGTTNFNVQIPTSLQSQSALGPGTYEIYYRIGTDINAIETTTRPYRFTVADCSGNSSGDQNGVLTVRPATQTIGIGEFSGPYDAYFDSDGPGPRPEQVIAYNDPHLVWDLLNPANASVADFTEVPGVYMALAPGTATVRAQYINPLTGNIFEGTASLVVESETLSVLLSLSPDPAEKELPFSTSLRADVDGSAVGPISYYFWWNCPASRFGNLPITIDNARRSDVCGDPQQSSVGDQYINVPATASTDSRVSEIHEYSESGTYYPFVIAKRNLTTAWDRKTLTLAPSVATCSNFAASRGQYVCLNKACTTLTPTTPPTFSWSCTTASVSCQVRRQGTSYVVCSSSSGSCAPVSLFTQGESPKSYTYELYCNGALSGQTRIQIIGTDGKEI